MNVYDPLSDEPLSTRDGMVREVIGTAKHYPLILVVVECGESISSLCDRFTNRSDSGCRRMRGKLRCNGCDIEFIDAQAVERYRGTVPVFYDPGPFVRKAA